MNLDNAVLETMALARFMERMTPNDLATRYHIIDEMRRQSWQSATAFRPGLDLP